MGYKKHMISLFYPWFLALLPLPILLRVLFFYNKSLQKHFPKTEISQENALNFPNYAIVTELCQDYTRSQFWHRKLFIPLVIWILLVVSLAQPILLDKFKPMPMTGRDLMLLIDVSGSMRKMDFIKNKEPISRLEMVKQIASTFIENRLGDRVGLILFGNKPYLRAALTHDIKAVSQLIKSSEIALAGESTAIGQAIGLAIKRMKDLKSQSRVIILLTDGANNEGAVNPEKAAELAALSGIRIYTIDIGGAESPAPNPFGVWSSEGALKYEKEVLQKVAKLTHGFFFHVLDSKGLTQAYKQLDLLEPAFTQDINKYLAQQLYPWTLSLALLISLLAVWKRWLPIYINSNTQQKLKLDKNHSNKTEENNE